MLALHVLGKHHPHGDARTKARVPVLHPASCLWLCGRGPLPGGCWGLLSSAGASVWERACRQDTGDSPSSRPEQRFPRREFWPRPSPGCSQGRDVGRAMGPTAEGVCASLLTSPPLLLSHWQGERVTQVWSAEPWGGPRGLLEGLLSPGKMPECSKDLPGPQW